MSTKAKAPQKVEDPFYNFEEAANYLGQTVRWLKGQHAEGNMPFTKMGALVRFRKSALDKWIAEHSTDPSDGGS